MSSRLCAITKVKVFPNVALLVMIESKGGVHPCYKAEEPVLSEGISMVTWLALINTNGALNTLQSVHLHIPCSPLSCGTVVRNTGKP